MRNTRKSPSRFRNRSLFIEALESRTVFAADGFMQAPAVTGESASIVVPKIINGTPTDAYPSVGLVGDVENGDFCTGTLIASQFVLTAGHCGEGVADTKGTFVLGNTTYRTSKVYVHPQYQGVINDSDSDYDISLYKLSTAVTNVAPSNIFRGTPVVGQLLTLVGYGYGGTGNSGSDNVFGIKRSGTTPIDQVTTRLLRWSFDNNNESNTAPGDSGGPAFVTIGSDQFIAGITSGGSLDNAGLGDQSFDTRIDAFQTWIDGIVNPVTPTPSAAAGDIVITAFQSDNPDGFSFVATVPLAGSSDIRFTDNAWDGSALLKNEGTVTYRTPAAGLTAGTKVVISVTSNTQLSVISGGGTVSATTGTGFGSSFGLSTSGDSIIAYRGNYSAPEFLYAFSNIPFVTTSVNANSTQVPQALTVGTSAVALSSPEADDVRYNEVLGTVGSASTIRALVSNPANWLKSDTPVAISTANFTIQSNSAPQITPLNGVSGLAGAPIVLQASATDPDAGQTLTYAWDFNYDGTTFDVDATGTSVATSYPVSGSYTAAVRVTDSGSPALSSIATTTVTVSSSIVQRTIFYRGSAFDTTTSSQSAIDPTKSALVTGKATIANYSIYAFGINGIIIDVLGLGTRSLSLSDFQFKVGKSDDLSTWTTLAASAFTATPITVLAGQGENGSDRIKISFENNSIVRTWLQVTVLSNANSGLSTNDVFYFGSAPGDVVVSPGLIRVNSSDEIAIRQATSSAAVAITKTADIDKDGKVNGADLILVRKNLTSASALPLIDTATLRRVDRAFQKFTAADYPG